MSADALSAVLARQAAALNAVGPTLARQAAAFNAVGPTLARQAAAFNAVGPTLARQAAAFSAVGPTLAQQASVLGPVLARQAVALNAVGPTLARQSDTLASVLAQRVSALDTLRPMLARQSDTLASVLAQRVSALDTLRPMLARQLTTGNAIRAMVAHQAADAEVISAAVARQFAVGTAAKAALARVPVEPRVGDSVHETGSLLRQPSRHVYVVDEIDAFLEQRLGAMKPAFLAQFRGSTERGEERGPDWWTQAAASARKLLLGVLHTAAPDDLVLPWVTHPKQLDQHGHPTRRTKIAWLCRSIPNETYQKLVKTDLESALVLIDTLHAAVHVDEFPEFEATFSWIYLRVKVAIQHILEIWWKERHG